MGFHQQLYLGLLIVCFLINNVSSQSCSAFCKAGTKSPGDKVEDPQNCHQFYFCVASSSNSSSVIPSDNPFKCPSGEFFDTVVGDCVTEVTPCTSTCIPDPSNCNSMVCSGYPGQPYADTNDCSTYYVCSPTNDSILLTCKAPDLYFNGEECVPDISQCCTTRMCTPYCGVGEKYTNVADPCDCTSYYFCENSTYVPTFSSSCDYGQVFNSETQSCVTGSFCTSTCTALQCGISTTTKTSSSAPSSGNPTKSSTETSKKTPTETPSTITTSNNPFGTCIDIDTYTCTADGYFARCDFCDPSFYQCQNGVVISGECDDPYVFNPVPAYPGCILPADCPLYP